MLKWNCRTDKELTRIHLQWNVLPGVQDIRISPCMLPTEDVTWWYMTSTFTINVNLKLSNGVCTLCVCLQPLHPVCVPSTTAPCVCLLPHVPAFCVCVCMHVCASLCTVQVPKYTKCSQMVLSGRGCMQKEWVWCVATPQRTTWIAGVTFFIWAVSKSYPLPYQKSRCAAP